MKQFQLWLDESGCFDETSDSRDLYSFVGGVLVETEKSSQIDLKTFLSSKEYNHAMTLDMKAKKEYVIPKLLDFKKYTDARYIFFENIEYYGNGDNRLLYLQVLSEGLLQLTQLLEAKYGPIKLAIIIASRLAQKGDEKLVHITEEEYVRCFRKLLHDKQERNEFTVHESTQVQFHLERATKSLPLILADFASNTRRMYYRKKFKDRDSKASLSILFEDAYTFSMSELSSDTKIRILLGQNDLSEAIMEVFTSQNMTGLQQKEYLKLILERMSHLSYRLIKSQIRQLTAEILAYSARQDNYDEASSLLKQIETQLIPLLKVQKYPYEVLEYEILLQLSDMYLRSGQLVEVVTVLTQLKEVVQLSENSLENIFLFYRMREKLAVFYIDSYQFSTAIQLMSEMRESFEGLMTNLLTYPMIQTNFSTLKSEYYGDVLCMEIYARLFRNQLLFEEIDFLRELSDTALQQYPLFHGELERHLQYRSRIEQKEGNIPEAIYWLMRAIDETYCFSETINQKELKRFWDTIYTQETAISQLFYLMYYSLILAQAMIEKSDWADCLYSSLAEHPIFQLIQKEKKNTDIHLLQASSLYYHPLDIIYWNLAEYHRAKGQVKESFSYYDQAIMICSRKKGTLTLQLRLVAILAARASLEIYEKQTAPSLKRAIQCVQSLEDKLARQSIFSKEISFDETMIVLKGWREQLEACKDHTDTSSEVLWAFSQEWRY
ncbi:hypothetical protein GGG87_06180 [Streptococcus sp. zg-86]|uniref:DUF3800 domain-containing protein n=1 Tax=Streptococcus zhangguiae TaxID=2664091 RepID=A0A6I4RD40_9STRE|nr:MULTISPECIES: hypothetical protein [unclassified Streptococcus]MTB64578.1 hypothetical protein [Streptococcus sp. zg-86]MTB90888.1 hypothetical protein [Streptococcus sp. zg-36]MWV56688.1 hypothetical protein [Streptococcus sp. zg-70]QTH48645.1 hypothetical protein J5M87_04815 [Streptococcus sp. zg-86]